MDRVPNGTLQAEEKRNSQQHTHLNEFSMRDTLVESVHFDILLLSPGLCTTELFQIIPAFLVPSPKHNATTNIRFEPDRFTPPSTGEGHS
jgi:hypothetical protein